ncbi:collagen alpha-1(I) chain-like [Ursus americanus]|uniref:collagen alpha-1(I) chain-like n=1 Tax=Ursus americanus TaxID=9643 RepID=UPI001E67B71D|nr:collagen alpha-1(I) chain-like [Ursus americanus]
MAMNRTSPNLGAGIAAKSEHAAARAAAVAAAAKEARGGSARSSAPGRPQARPSARTTSRLASSPTARELPRRAERPGEARRREHALHQTPGRGTPPSARLRRSARAAAAAGERGVFPAPRSPHAASQRDRERGRARREAPEGASGPSTRAGRPGDALQPACPCGSSLGPSADSSFAGAEIAKGSRRIGRSESPGLDELRTSGLSVPRASAGDLFAKWRWSRGGQCWNEAAPPAPTLLARGPGRGRGDTPCRRGRFSKPSYRKPSGSPGGDWLPAARNPLSGAGCQPVCKPLRPERLPRTAAGVPPRARRPLRSRSRLSRCRRRRWLRARNKSRGRARAHGPRAPGGQEARHHSGTARPRAAPVQQRRRAAPGVGQQGPLVGLYRAAWCWEGLRGEATRRPSCRGEKGAKSGPGSPELGLSYEGD